MGLNSSPLIQLQNGIWCNDSSSGEIDSLTHQVSSDSSFLTFKTRSDIFNRLAWRSVLLSWLILNIVVHQRGNQKLEIFENCFLCLLRLASFHIATELIVGSDNHSVSICEIILASHSITCLYRWPHRGRCDSQSLDNHPFRSCLLGIESQELHVLFTDLMEDFSDFFSS